jgi:hypothetical protein
MVTSKASFFETFDLTATDAREVVRKRAALCAEIAEATWIDCFTRRYSESTFRALCRSLNLTTLEEGWIRLQCV